MASKHAKPIIEIAEHLNLSTSATYRLHSLLPDRLRWIDSSKKNALRYDDEVIELLSFAAKMRKKYRKDADLKKCLHSRIKNQKIKKRKLEIDELSTYEYLNSNPVKTFRNITGMSQTKFAEMIGTYQTRISDAERGILASLPDSWSKGVTNFGWCFDDLSEKYLSWKKIDKQNIKTKSFINKKINKEINSKNLISNKSTNLSDEVNRLNEIIDQKNRTEKDLKERISLLEHSIDRLLSTIDASRHADPVELSCEIEKTQEKRDEIKKWWKIGPLVQILERIK